MELYELEERIPAGALAVADMWYQDFIAAIRRQDKNNVINRLCDERNIQEKYGNLIGFFWGLQAANVISCGECSELTECINDAYFILKNE